MNEPDKKNINWLAIEGEYMAGIDSIRAIANRHEVSEGAIRKKAKAKGWLRDPAKTKRQIVSSAMSGGTQNGTQIALRTIEAAAAQDIEDMERGLRINRMCLANLEDVAQASLDPKEIKIIVDATASAIESIRKIRGLDETPANGQDKALSVSDLTDDELMAELKRYGIEKP
jgi:hypothetical protein